MGCSARPAARLQGRLEPAGGGGLSSRATEAADAGGAAAAAFSLTTRLSSSMLLPIRSRTAACFRPRQLAAWGLVACRGSARGVG